MIKRQVFMAVTAFISIICFNFNKITSEIIKFISSNIYDDSVVYWGPYVKSIPIEIFSAYTNDSAYKICTNKIKLLLNWKWDFDIQGITTTDIKLLGTHVEFLTINYKKKHSNEHFTCNIDLKNNTISIKKDKQPVFKKITFNEIRLGV